MDPVAALVASLVAAVVDGEVFWPGLGAFSLQGRRRMPGFPGYKRVSFRPAEQLFRALNDGEDPPLSDRGDTSWIQDVETALRGAWVATEELVRKGEVTIAGLGLFALETRRTTAEPYYFVAFHTDPDLLRTLNPRDEDYEAVLAMEWPAGPPDRGEIPEA